MRIRDAIHGFLSLFLFPERERKGRTALLSSRKTAPVKGTWYAAGRHEGLDMLVRGRLCYYPIGRGFVRFEEEGRLLLTAINAAGTHVRCGRYGITEEGRLTVQIGEGCGSFFCIVSGESMTLCADRKFYRRNPKELHEPVFKREPGRRPGKMEQGIGGCQQAGSVACEPERGDERARESSAAGRAGR